MADRTGLPDGSRLRLIGGSPTAAEVAAVLLAVDQALAADAREKARPRLPGWLRAARREALGGPPAADPGALRELR